MYLLNPSVSFKIDRTMFIEFLERIESYSRWRAEKNPSRLETITHIALIALSAINACSLTVFVVCLSAAVFVFCPLYYSGALLSVLTVVWCFIVVCALSFFIGFCQFGFLLLPIAKMVKNDFQGDAGWEARAKTISLVALAVLATAVVCCGAVMLVLYGLPAVVLTAFSSFSLLAVAGIFTVASLYFFADGCLFFPQDEDDSPRRRRSPDIRPRDNPPAVSCSQLCEERWPYAQASLNPSWPSTLNGTHSQPPH
jgi:hypothetical protein